MKNTIYIDIGNTNIKICYKNKILRLKTKKTYTINSLFMNFPNELKIMDINNIFASNVIFNFKNIFDKLFIKHFKCSITWVNYLTKTNIKLDIDNPKEIGSDLISIATYGSYRYNEVIVINLGTTITYTYIENKCLKGVIISPGIFTQYNSLMNSTSQLQNIKLKYINKLYGKNTEESISIGIINNTCEIIKKTIKKINPKSKVIISGGDMNLFKNILNFEFIPEVTIEGLKIIKEINNEN